MEVRKLLTIHTKDSWNIITWSVRVKRGRVASASLYKYGGYNMGMNDRSTNISVIIHGTDNIMKKPGQRHEAKVVSKGRGEAPPVVVLMRGSHQRRRRARSSRCT